MNLDSLLSAEIDSLAERAEHSLREHGYSKEEIHSAIHGPLNSSRLRPTEDGEYVAPQWWYVEALRSLHQARDALSADNKESARRHLSEAREALSSAQIEHMGRAAEIGTRRREQQSQRGQRGATQRWGGDGRDALAGIIERLASRKDAMGDYEPPADLWDALHGEMDDAGLSPRETADGAYRYAGDEQTPLTYDAFRKRINRHRK